MKTHHLTYKIARNNFLLKFQGLQPLSSNEMTAGPGIKSLTIGNSTSQRLDASSLEPSFTQLSNGLA